MWKEAIKYGGLELPGQTLSTKRSDSSPCQYLDRLRDCTIMSRIRPSEIHEVTVADVSTDASDDSVSASTRAHSDSDARKWYNVVGSAKLRGFVPRRWRAAATVVSYFEGGAGPGLYSFHLLTCNSGQTPFYAHPTSSQGVNKKAQPTANGSSDTVFENATLIRDHLSSSTTATPQDIIIGEFEVVSVHGFFVNPIHVDTVRDGLPNIYATSTPPTTPQSARIPASPASVLLQPSPPTYFEASSASTRGHALFHHSSFTTASTTSAAIAHGTMASIWFIALLGSWVIVHWRLARKLPFLHPLLALPSLYIYLRLIAFAFFAFNLYEALLQHELHRLGYMSLGMIRRPSCAATFESSIPNEAYDASASWQTLTASFQTTGVRKVGTPLSVPTASRLLMSQLYCSSIYDIGGTLPQSSLVSTEQWPLIQLFAIKILPALLWSSCMGILTLTMFYISRGGSLTRPWGLDRKTRIKALIFTALIVVTVFISAISSSLATNASRQPNDTPTPTHTGASWFLRNMPSDSDAKRETNVAETTASTLQSLIPTSLVSYLTTAILPNKLIAPKMSVVQSVLLDNSLFWRLCSYAIIVLATKSCLASCSLISDSLQKQLTILEREFHATSSNARDLWNLSHTRPAVPTSSSSVPPAPSSEPDRSSPLVGRSSALSQILDPSTSSLAAETAVTPRAPPEEPVEDEETVRRRERRQLREERKRSPVVLLSKLVRSVRRKLSTFKVIQMTIAITFALGAFLALISPSWALSKAKILNAILTNLLCLLFFAIFSYLFIPDKSKFKALFHLNKYLRRLNRREERKKKAQDKRTSANVLKRSANGIEPLLFSESVDSEDFELDESSMDPVQPLLPFDADEGNDDGTVLELEDLKPAKAALNTRTKKNGKWSELPLDDEPDRQFSSSLLQRASLLADKDGFLSEEAKKSLWGETIGSGSTLGPSPTRASMRSKTAIGTNKSSIDGEEEDDGTESVSSTASALLPPRLRSGNDRSKPHLDIPSRSSPGLLAISEEEGFNTNPFSLVIIYPPSVKVTVPAPQAIEVTPTTTVDLVSPVGGDDTDPEAPFVLPFAPVPLHPRLAARLKRSSPLPPSMMAALSSPTPPLPTPPVTTSSVAAPPTILPPSIALARMANPISHSETVIFTPRK